ncbi:MAG: zeta toxin family protein [Paludibacteraceae bacterium]|nr:zeta toxin family protein [Paludibacteraceae bacterium]
MQHPNLYIIAGPNGAGKTTASYTLLPEILHCVNFVNADEIARGLSPFSPETVDVQAARIMLDRIEELLSQKADFGIETTLATRSYVQLVRRAQASGYKVHLLFFYLETPEQAIQRVAQRVSNGGHGIPEEVIRRRFKRGIDNLLNLYLPICDSVLIYNNIKTPAQLIVRKKSRREKVEVVEDVMWNQLIQKYE